MRPEIHVVPVQRTDGAPHKPLHMALTLLPDGEMVRTESQRVRQLVSEARSYVEDAGFSDAKLEMYRGRRRPRSEAEELFREAVAVWVRRMNPATDAAPAMGPGAWNRFPGSRGQRPSK